MKNLLLILIILFITGCGICKPTTNTIIQYKDSTITHLVDSVVYIPVERITDVIPVYDTLKLETSKAKAQAYVDTASHVLRGSIENKSGVEYKYIYRDKVVVKDSIITKEVPVEIQVEKIVRKNPWYFPLLIPFILLGLATLIKILYKIYVHSKG